MIFESSECLVAVHAESDAAALLNAQAVSHTLQRILQVEYEFPPHVKVSKECRDLLHKILVPDPAKRITVPEIQNHVWYKKDLPPGVSDMNDNLPPPGAGLQVSSQTKPADFMHNMLKLLAKI